jgi:hypothetical protein
MGVHTHAKGPLNCAGCLRQDAEPSEALMKRFVAVALAGAAFALLIGPRGPLGGFWRPAAEAPTPQGGVLAGFVAEGFAEALAFGVGVAILLFGRSWFASRAATSARGTTAWLATVWLFASWMPHAALHLHIGLRPEQLLAVEWIFHVGAVVALAALLWALAPNTRPATERDGVRPASIGGSR